MKLKGLGLKDLWWFSLPSIFSSLFEPLAGIVDTALVGHYNVQSLASLAVGVTLFNTLTWVFNFLVHASTQNIADFEAAKNKELLKKRLKISLILALGIGTLCTFILLFFKERFFGWAGGQAALYREFETYYDNRAYFHIFALMATTLLGILRGLGHLRLVLVLMVASTLGNIVLSYLWLYWWPIGLKGVAYGTVLSQLLVCVVGLVVVFKDPSLRRGFGKIPIDNDQWLKFGKSSLGQFTRAFFLTLSFFMATRMAGQMGVVPLAAHQIVLQIWLLSSFFLDGLAISGNILGARFYFGHYQKRTRMTYLSLTKLSLIVGSCFMAGYLLFWPQVSYLFTDDPLILRELENLRWLVSLFQPLCALTFIVDGLVFGLNGFSFLGRHMIIGVIGIFFPMAFLTKNLKELFWLWLAMGALNIYRTLSGFWFVRKKVFKETIES